MNTTIYYFSGTGNSYVLAKKIADKISHANIIPVKSVMGEKNIDIPTESVGFVFPVYCVDVPEFMIELIDRMDFKKTAYIFAAVTCGGTPGNTLYTIDKLLKQKGKILNYGYEVKLGDNSIVYSTPADELRKRIKNLEEISHEIAHNIIKRRDATVDYIESHEAVILKKTLTVALENDLHISKKSVNIESCSQCGLCAKICPKNNIIICDGEIRWGEKCIMCFACLNWCPSTSIRFGEIAPKASQQYHFPGITPSDLL